MTYAKREVQGADLLAFKAAVQQMVNDHHTKNKYVGNPPEIGFTNGQKFIRFFKAENGGRNAFCFVDLSNGDILKADGWKRPAKGARGNIFTPTWGVEHLTPYGAAYAR